MNSNHEVITMLIKSKKLKDYQLGSLTGEMGKVKDFYFDDKHWTIRYLVVDTGHWLTGRLVLISPYALVETNHTDKLISVNLTKKQIEDSPSINNQKPVSKQFEDAYYKHYGWVPYWFGPSVWGPYAYPGWIYDKPNEISKLEKPWDPNLRSVREIIDYRIQATDGEIGHIDDFVVDDRTWTIRYLIVDTRNWWTRKEVLISPEWITRVSWNESKVFVNLQRDTIKLAPEYTDESLASREYENLLHRHYQKMGYWSKDEL
jgi:sporulation protein YlmC with PRC-barrel domain